MKNFPKHSLFNKAFIRTGIIHLAYVGCVQGSRISLSGGSSPLTLQLLVVLAGGLAVAAVLGTVTLLAGNVLCTR